MKFRIEQRKNEPPDMTIMRAFAKAIPLMRRHHALAALGWMIAVSNDPKTEFAPEHQDRRT